MDGRLGDESSQHVYNLLKLITHNKDMYYELEDDREEQIDLLQSVIDRPKDELAQLSNETDSVFRDMWTRTSTQNGNLLLNLDNIVLTSF